MKNVLYLTTDSRMGGAEKMILLLMQNLKDINPVLCTLMSKGAINRYAEKMGFREYCLGIDSPCQIFRSFKLKGIILKNKIDIVHTHLYHANILGNYFSNKINNAKFVYTMHRCYKKTLLGELNYRILKKNSHKIICVSRSIQHLLKENMKISSERLSIIYNGIKDEYPSWEKTVDQKEELKKKFRIIPDCYIISVIANLNNKKGHRRLLNVLKNYRFNRKYMCLIVGDGPLMATLVRQVQALGLSNRVRFLGHQENIFPILTFTDLFVLPSTDEGLPVSVIEAMMMRLAIVATDVGALRELIDDNYSGTIVHRESNESLGDGIQFHMSQTSRSMEMANNARVKYLEKFQLEAMVSQTQNVYNGL